MQSSDKNNMSADDTKERQYITIGAVAFTVLAFFFLFLLFKGPGINKVDSDQQPTLGMAQPNQLNQPPPKLDLSITEKKDEKPSADQQNQQPDNLQVPPQTSGSETMPQDQNSITFSVNPDQNVSDQSSSTPASADSGTDGTHDTGVSQSSSKQSAQSPSQTTAAPQSKAAIYVVQAGAYSDKAHAEKTAADLRNKGYKVQIQTSLAENLTLYRVQIGGFKSKDEARKVADELASHGYSPAIMTD